MKINKAKLLKFITEAQEEVFEGTRYFELDDTYSVVAAYNDYGQENYGLDFKIAYNCDDLQCNYDSDWMMPTDINGDVIDTEITYCVDLPAEGILDFILNDYKLIKK